MKDRIAHIMRAKNLKASDFASLLGIQPSAVSHILAGRNKPTLEIVRKIKETFPEYNLDWLIFGTGPVTTSEPFKEPSQVASPSLFELEPEEEMAVVDSEKPEEGLPRVGPTVSFPSSGIRSIVVFYEDGTFESFLPR